MSAQGLYLGRDVDGGADYRLKPERLRTHGVVVGMTGSGKTGLCLVLLEELARKGIPIIALDPKGDLGNLGLVFDELSAEQFEPWAGSDDPNKLSERYKKGTSQFGLTLDDVAGLRKKLDFRVYTPGSESGISVNLLGSFARPADKVLEDNEARRDLVADTVSGLLGLVGREADPVKDPAHVVLSFILDSAWAAGEDPDLETIILRLVDPPFEKVGVFPVDKFFPPDQRMDLAMAFNGVVASPSFAPWTTGVALDVDRMLTQGDKTQVHVFSIAHLSDGERQFFVSLLLGKLLAWSRGQAGTEDLRAVLFFDEVAGYLPPHPKRPPTKGPLLTMMKQARAVGLGVVLATQNPVDIDYKALSNAGLWCIGRLGTQQDRDRLLKGIDGAGLDQKVANLEKRQFLIHQVGRGEPSVIGSRHAMCFLRGPVTRVEYAKLNGLYGAGEDATPVAKSGPASRVAAPSAAEAPAEEVGDLMPVAPSVQGVSQWFLDPRVVFSARMEDRFSQHAEEARSDKRIVHRAALYAELELRFDEDRVGFVLDHVERRTWFPLHDEQERLPEPMGSRIEADDLEGDAVENALFAPLPTWMDEAKELKRIQKQVADDVYRSETRGMFVNKKLKLYGRPEESEEDFAARARVVVDEKIETDVAKLKDRFEAKADKIQDKIEQKKLKLVELEGVARSRQLEEVVNVGEAIWSIFSGRRRSLGSAVSKRRQSSAASNRVEQYKQQIDQLEEEAADLTLELEEAVEKITEKHEALLDATETKEVRLEKADVRLTRFGIVWVPVSRRI